MSRSKDSKKTKKSDKTKVEEKLPYASSSVNVTKFGYDVNKDVL